MTNEEAIYKLNSDCAQMINECQCNDGLCDCHIDIAIKAIKKQIPRKTIDKYRRCGFIVEGRCPWCGRSVFAEHKYCSVCGQALEWGEL